MAVNLSPRQFSEPGLAGTVRDALLESGLPAGRLCLEITESAVMADPNRAAATLRERKALGVQLAIDDFGTGHSSLGHLRFLLPVDVLKIDRSFVQGLATSAADRAIVTAVVDLAQRLGPAAVAEGVEEQAEVDVLRELRCTLAQGFVFSRPHPPGVLEAALGLRRAA